MPIYFQMAAADQTHFENNQNLKLKLDIWDTHVVHILISNPLAQSLAA